jgi:hypothetical protein
MGPASLARRFPGCWCRGLGRFDEVLMAKKCEFQKKSGERCGADAQISKSVCVFQDPDRAADGRRAMRRVESVAVTQLRCCQSTRPIIHW